jgi:hypothetical protein
MSERASQLHAAVDEQVGELLDLVSTMDETTSHLPVPGRAKLGDGTVAANARHTAENYQRIADFVSETDHVPAPHEPAQARAHRPPRFLGRLRHKPPHGRHGPGGDPGQHEAPYTADNTDLGALIEQLGYTRASLARVAELSDGELDDVPPAGSFRFADGKRTVEQVLSGLFKHQRHQIDVLKTAVG